MTVATYSDTDRAAALRMLSRGMPRESVVYVIGCQRRTLNRWAADLGIDIRRGRGGAKQQLPKKTEDKIAALASRGHGQREIARMVGWSPTTVMRALRRRGMHP